MAGQADRVSAPAIDIEKSVNGEDADVPPGPIVLVGSMVTFSYVVTNTGNVTLDGVLVTDSVLGPISMPKTSLAPGESMTGIASAAATAGQYANLGTVTATDPTQATVSDNDPGNYIGFAPAISIVKVTNGADGLFIPVGDPITWTYTVTNTGNVTLSNVTVTDDQGVVPVLDVAASTGEEDGAFDPNDVWVYTASGIAVAGQYDNTGAVVGTSPTGAQVSDTDPSNYFGSAPAITLVKTGALDLGANAQADPGDVINYMFTVTNTGNMTLSNVTLSDFVGGVTIGPLTDTAGNGIDVLEPGDVETATGSYAITQFDIDAGSKFNQALVTGITQTEQQVEATDDHTEPIPAPAPPLLGSLSGTVYLDRNNNGKQEKKEKGIKNVLVRLQFLVGGVWTTVATARTNAKGKYFFNNLGAGMYRIVETQPKGFRDGKDTLGRINGVPKGSKAGNDRFIVSLLSGAGVDYNFGERPTKMMFI